VTKPTGRDAATASWRCAALASWRCAALVTAAIGLFACGTGAPAPRAAKSAAPAAPALPDDAAGVREGRELAGLLLGRDALASDPRLLRYVALVGRTVAGPSLADRFRFAVTRSDLPYATAFPGGIVVLSRGLIFQMGSEAELAVTLSREICHAQAGGAREFPGGAAEAVDTAHEIALDACGVRLASRAGYDAAAFLHLLETLQDRAASVREKSNLDRRREELRKLPEAALGGKLLAERFRRSAIM